MNKLPKGLIRGGRSLAVLGAVSLALTRELSPVLFFVFALAFLSGLRIDRYPSLVRILRKAQPYFALSMFVVSIVDMMYVSRSFLLVVAHFLLGLQALRLLGFQTVRDVGGCMLLASLMILSASTLSVEWTFLVVLLVFLPAVIWTLIMMTITSESQVVTYLQHRALKGSDDEKELKKVAAGLSEEYFVSEKNPLWMRMVPGVRGAALIAFSVAILCCLTVFIGFPRFNFRGFRGQFLQPVHKSGFTTQVDLNKQGNIGADQSIVMRIQIRPEDQDVWPGYVRGTALEIFDGKSWKRDLQDEPKTLSGASGEVRVAFNNNVEGQLLHQSIFLESLDSSVLFAAPMPVVWKIDRPYILAFGDGSFRRPFNDTWRTQYEVDSFVSKRPQNLLSHMMMRKDDRRSLTSIPSGFESVLDLGQKVSSSGKSSLEKARLLERHLRQGFSYTLNFDGGGKENPLEDFLFNTKKGNCEFFASALCIMLRGQGIPSRVVAGFYSKEWNSQGNYYIVRSRDAHAWVEAFVAGSGWVQLDPSPRTFDQGADSWATRFKDSVDYLNLRWNRYVLSYDFDRQVQVVQAVNERSRGLTVNFDRIVQRWRQMLPSWQVARSSSAGRIFGFSALLNLLPVFIVLSGVFIAAWVRRQFLRRKNRVWFYRRVVLYLEKKNGHKKPSSTLREFLAEAKPNVWNNWDDLQFLIDHYYRVRFSSQSRINTEETKQIKQALSRLGR